MRPGIFIYMNAVAPMTCELSRPRRVILMLWTIAIVLVLLWALGLITGTTVSGFVHVLLVLAIIAVLIRLIQGRRVL